MSRSSVLSLEIKNDILKVEEEMRKICAVGAKPLGETSLYTLEAGGKRLRPALVLISAKSGQYSLERLIPAAAALELIHMASLVHDDILDGAETRRGARTINSQWGSRTAVTTGDFLFAQAFVLLARTGSSQVVDIACEAAVSLSLGELQQTETARKCDQGISDYFEKIFNKTAALFAASCEIGAILSNVSSKEVALLRGYGKDLGMAFQIYDDVLDLQGSEEELGKPIGLDLKDGTVTMPILYALEETNGDARLRSVIEKDGADPAEIEAAIALVLGTKAIERTKEQAFGFAQNAIEAANQLSDQVVKEDLTAIGQFVIDRYH